MKAIRVFSLLALVFVPCITFAGVMPAERLVELETELGRMKIAGIGESHPDRLSVEKDIAVIERDFPGIRDADYMVLLVGRLEEFKGRLARAEQEGMGRKHPSSVELRHQVALMERRVAEIIGRNK